MKGTTLSRREMLKLAGLGVIGTVLAACGPQTPPATQAPAAVPTATPAAAPAATPTTAAAAAIPEVPLPTGNALEGFVPKLSNPAEKIKLVYWWGNNYEPAMQFTHQVIQRFSIAYPNVTVEPVGGQNCDAFVTAAAAGTPPDFFHTWDCVERMGNWAKRGMIVPLDDYIAKDKFDLTDYIPGVMETCKMEGKTWGMVDTGGVFLLWTRPPQFADIGKSASDLPKDTDELWDWAKKLTTKDADGNVQRLGMTIPTWTWSRFTWLVNFGGELWDSNAGVPTPDHPGVLEALRDMVSQVNAYGVEALDRWSTSIGSQSGEQNPWLAGNLTMQVDGDWTGQTIFDFHADWQAGKDYGIVDPPPPPKSKQRGESAVAFWSWPLVVPGGTKYPEWSWELMRFFLSPEYQLNVHGKFKEVVVRKSMMADKRQWWPAAKVAQDIVKGGRKITAVMPMNPVAAEYINLLAEAFDKVLHLTETPEDSMARVKQETLAKLNA